MSSGLIRDTSLSKPVHFLISVGFFVLCALFFFCFISVHDFAVSNMGGGW